MLNFYMDMNLNIGIMEGRPKIKGVENLILRRQPCLSLLKLRNRNSGEIFFAAWGSIKTRRDVWLATTATQQLKVGPTLRKRTLLVKRRLTKLCWWEKQEHSFTSSWRRISVRVTFVVFFRPTFPVPTNQRCCILCEMVKHVFWINCNCNFWIHISIEGLLLNGNFLDNSKTFVAFSYMLIYASFWTHPDNQYVLHAIQVISARFNILQTFINHKEIIWHFLHNFLFHLLWTFQYIFYKYAIVEAVYMFNLSGFYHQTKPNWPAELLTKKWEFFPDSFHMINLLSTACV